MPPELPEKKDVFNVEERESNGGPFELTEDLFECSTDQQLQEKLNLIVDENLELRNGVTMPFLQRFVVMAITVNMYGQLNKTVYQQLFLKLLSEDVEFESDDLSSCVDTLDASMFFANFDLLKSKLDNPETVRSIVKLYLLSDPFVCILNLDKIRDFFRSIDESFDESFDAHVEDILYSSIANKNSIPTENLNLFISRHPNLDPSLLNQIREVVFFHAQDYINEVILHMDFYADFFTAEQLNELKPLIEERLEEDNEMLFDNFNNLKLSYLDVNSLMRRVVSRRMQNREYTFLLDNLNVIQNFYYHQSSLPNGDIEVLNLVSAISNDSNFDIYFYWDSILETFSPQICKNIILSRYERDLRENNIMGILGFLNIVDDMSKNFDVGLDVNLVDLSNSLELDDLDIGYNYVSSQKSHELLDLMLIRAMAENYDTFVSHIHFASSKFDYSSVISESIDITLAKRFMTNISLLNKLSSTYVQTLLDTLLRDDVNFIFDTFFQVEYFEPENTNSSQSAVPFKSLNHEKQMLFINTFIDNNLWLLIYHADKCVEAPGLSRLREIIGDETFVPLDYGFAVQSKEELYIYDNNLELVDLILKEDLVAELANYGVTYNFLDNIMSQNVIQSREALDNGNQEFFNNKRLQVVFCSRKDDARGALSGSHNVNNLYSADANTLYFEIETEDDMYAYMNQLSELGVNIDLLLFIGHGSSNGISLGSADERGQLDISDREELQAVANSARHILQGTQVVLWSCKTGAETDGENIADVIWSTIGAQGMVTAPMMSVLQPRFRYYKGNYQVTFPQDYKKDQKYVLENLMFRE